MRCLLHTQVVACAAARENAQPTSKNTSYLDKQIRCGKTKHLGTHTFAARSECARPKWTTLRARHTGCGIARAVRAPRAHRTRVARAPRTHCAHHTRTVRAPYAHRTRTVRAPYARRAPTVRTHRALYGHCTRTPP